MFAAHLCLLGHLQAAPLIGLESPPGQALARGGVVDFGTTALNIPVQRVFRIRNLGDVSVNGLSIASAIIRTTPSGFSPAPLSSTTLLPGEHVDFTVTFSPVDGGLNWEHALISSDQAGAGFVLSMSGTGEGPEIVISSPTLMNGMSAAFQFFEDGATTVPFRFGRVSQAPRERGTFYLDNSGTQPLQITGISFSGAAASDFSVTAFPGTIPAGGATVPFTLSFSPSAVGVRNAVFHVFTNDSNEASFDIPLQGYGMNQIEEWRLDHFGELGSGHMSGIIFFWEDNWEDYHDPDGDGIPNFMEFATGQHPTNSSTPAQNLSRGTGGECIFTYQRSKAAVADGLLFTVQHNATLDPGGWSSLGVTETILSDDGTLQTVQAAIPAPTGGSCFTRLRVARP
jgi:hypothetical protein